MDARFDDLIDRLVEELLKTKSHYSRMPIDELRAAATTLYSTIRASIEDDGMEQFRAAITQIGRHRMAQGGSPDDLRIATDLVRQVNLSLVNDLAHNEPQAAAAAFAWLDRLATTSLEVFTTLAQESLARQAEELNISITLSERLEQVQRLGEAADAVFEQLPHIGVDRAIMALAARDNRALHEVISVFDQDTSAPDLPQGTRFAPELLLNLAAPGNARIVENVAESELPVELRTQLGLSGIQTLAAFPLGAGARGLLILGYRQSHHFTPDEQRFLALMARLLRNRIANLLLVERLHEQVERATIFRSLAEGANDMIVMNDLSGTITYANSAAARLLAVERAEDLVGQPYMRFVSAQDHGAINQQMAALRAKKEPWKGAYTLMTTAGEHVPVVSSSIPLFGTDGTLIGTGGIARDERERLALIESLRQSNDDQRHMLELLRQLSTPLVPVMDGILVMPIVGDVDTRRASQIMETLLDGVSRAAADTIILDITGVPLVDTGVANALIQAARAVRLLGAEALLVGITPEVAQTLVGLGADLRELVTRGDLRSGIMYALRRRGYQIVRDETARASART